MLLACELMVDESLAMQVDVSAARFVPAAPAARIVRRVERLALGAGVVLALFGQPLLGADLRDPRL
jgi:hypothetical protein